MHAATTTHRTYPSALIGGADEQRRRCEDQSAFAFADEHRLADVHLTVMQKVFGCPTPRSGERRHHPDLLA